MCKCVCVWGGCLPLHPVHSEETEHEGDIKGPGHSLLKTCSWWAAQIYTGLLGITHTVPCSQMSTRGPVGSWMLLDPALGSSTAGMGSYGIHPADPFVATVLVASDVPWAHPGRTCPFHLQLQPLCLVEETEATSPRETLSVYLPQGSP